jgi:competence protein ComEA
MKYICFNYRLIILASVVIIPSACATLPQHVSSQVHLNLVRPNAERGSAININTASPEELETLPGVGKVIAERIIMHREQYGPFRREEHLMMVRGISDRKFRALRPMIKVE